MTLSISTELHKVCADDVKKLAFKILRNVTLATPVDTGRARGNWQISIDEPIKKQSDEIDKSGLITMQKATNVINSAADNEDVIFWIVNNLPYIGRLNDGHSEQAPKNFVETAIKAAINDSKS